MTNGDIGKKQKMVAEILEGCYQSCIGPDDDTKAIFVADAIISNPPTFAHIHCAEALGIPLLLSFTMPWCPTTAFPHPLVNVLQRGSTEANVLNYYSYGLVDLMTWQGYTKHLCAEDLVGFYFLDLAKDYQPPQDLVDFLNAGPPPIYIGFGSIVLDNPMRITETILAGVAQAGVRAIISPGWGGLDENMIKSAGQHVFALGNVPHDWLFQYPWWAAQIARRGAGPSPLDHKKLTSDIFASAVQVALSPSSLGAAREVGKMIMREDGAEKGVESFHRHLPLLNMRCDLTPNRVAVWYSAKYKLRLSVFAAQVLAEAKHIKLKKLKLHRSREYNPYVEAVDPVTGTVIPALRSLNNMGRGLVKVPTKPGKGIAQFTRASVRGVQGTLQGAAEGISNMPKLYGSEVREHKRVTGIGSGIAQGTKGLVLGVYDGISDFVTEPVKGLKNDGFYGAIGGLGVGTLNLVTKPVGGALQFVSMPMEGTAISFSHKEIEKDRIVARQAEGIVASERASLQERSAVIEAFVEYKAKRKRDKKGKNKCKTAA
ncbi:Sterol 3-beta-glucosyltransferase [Rhizoctonia solani AG-1 IB]|uniref:Sterol 3-beta-glucosyltransferase n=1 Tax=Thanatephorus cucumeris (strain AG1-IB / isolate 7/3/14) TaxID=1108050 RepID=M5C8L6_THACB|nr:Sterol 3-beta-glucosyltransferase [Rhizoctonia solani AG-1 IB]